MIIQILAGWNQIYVLMHMKRDLYYGITSAFATHINLFAAYWHLPGQRNTCKAQSIPHTIPIYQ